MLARKDKQPDQKQIVASLARESRVPIEDVAKLYEHELAELAVGAHLTKFLHIFAIRNVQEILRKRSAEEQASGLAGKPLVAI
ncbi:MAG: DUF3562 domain-containing protein [Usitatibacter sp.]